MMTRYYQWFIWGLLTAIITIAAKGILMVPQDLSTLTTSTFAGHEWQYNLYRLVAMADAFSEGMPGRWIENFSVGWGYPLFQFTGPLPYTFGAILLNIGFDATATLNFSWLLAYIAAGISMLWSSKPIFGRWGALLATTCYLLAPYHLVDTYVRTNLVETSAFIFPPLILNALWQLREKPQKAILIGAIGVMLLPLTHMLSTYLIGLGLTIFTLIYILLLPSNRRLSTLRGAILIATFGLALSAFFWLPALVDIETVRGMGAITEGFYSYDKHFVYPHQLISDDWYYGGSEEGPRDHMSFSLGKVTLLRALIALVISVIYFITLRVKEISVSAYFTS
ncbi:MAG: hypothetical protein GY787_22095 [Alteromonadales bacterium]|nr:hypothetical protein [Alteromonadales bacterium]